MYMTEGNLAYQLERREEIINGEVVMLAAPYSNHNRVAGNIYHMFRSFLRGRRCEPFGDGEGVYFEDGKEEYQPDCMVVCDPDKVQPDGIHGAPDLVVEILSPGTARYDRGHKMRVYEKHGVREYWIVNPADLSVEQYTLEQERFVLRGVWSIYPEYLLKHMKPEERAAVETEFPCALFEDLRVKLEDVFYRVAPEN